MDEALKMVEDHHHLHWADDCEIVVLEEMPIPEMENLKMCIRDRRRRKRGTEGWWGSPLPARWPAGPPEVAAGRVGTGRARPPAAPPRS